jgi:hypothetical protein
VRQSIRQLDASHVGLGYFQLETCGRSSAQLLRRPARLALHRPGDVTQHYLYASLLPVPLVLLGTRHRRALVMVLALGSLCLVCPRPQHRPV